MLGRWKGGKRELLTGQHSYHSAMLRVNAAYVVYVGCDMGSTVYLLGLYLINKLENDGRDVTLIGKLFWHQST
jgi:hypothetical protein